MFSLEVVARIPTQFRQFVPILKVIAETVSLCELFVSAEVGEFLSIFDKQKAHLDIPRHRRVQIVKARGGSNIVASRNVRCQPVRC